jgi:Tyrosine phosphatase family
MAYRVTLTGCYITLNAGTDLASVQSSGIKPNRVYRTGYPSRATAEDTAALLEGAGIRTLVDLRSKRELRMDEQLNGGFYEGQFLLYLLSNFSHPCHTQCLAARYATRAVGA